MDQVCLSKIPLSLEDHSAYSKLYANVEKEPMKIIKQKDSEKSSSREQHRLKRRGHNLKWIAVGNLRIQKTWTKVVTMEETERWMTKRRPNWKTERACAIVIGKSNWTIKGNAQTPDTWQEREALELSGSTCKYQTIELNFWSLKPEATIRRPGVKIILF